MNKLDKQYTALLQDILDNGVTKQDRTGTGTLSVFGRQIRHKMSEGFPLLTTKKMPFKTITTELLWFLRGDTNIKFLVDNNCHIWDGDAYKRFTYYTDEETSIERFVELIKTDDEFAKKWGELGPIYGKQWRSWNQFEEYDDAFEVDILEENEDSVSFSMGTSGMVYEIDQIAKLINDLKTNPDSRRLMVNAWNVGELDQMTLPPCHYGFQVYTRELSLDEKEWQLEKTNCINDIENDRMIYGHEWEKYIQEQYEGIQSTQSIKIPTRAISLMYNARSQDVPLGTPFNISSYALLLEIIGKMVNMIPDELIANMGDCHIYLNQIDGIKEQLTREPYQLPTLKHMKTDEFYKSLSEDLSLLTHLDSTDFIIENYQSHPTIKMPLSN
jgi:thymidylate synthase